MSKLAHSDDGAMAEIEVNSAIADGQFERVGLCALFTPPRCEQPVSQGQWNEKAQTWDSRCSFGARFETDDGTQLCEMHAKKWATAFIQKMRLS